MKKAALYFAAVAFMLLSVLQGCRVQSHPVSEREQEEKYEQAFIESFRTLSFCACMEYGFGNKLNLYLEDASCRYPDYLYGEKSFIDSLARQQLSLIRRDSTSSIGRVAEGMEGKRVVDACLRFYEGEQLKELARTRYKADRKLRE